MADLYDLVVIGTGVAAQAASARVRAAGWKTAIIDDRPFGGTCQLRGCDPKKVLVSAEEAIDWTRRMRGKGVAGDLRIDWPALMRFKRGFTDKVPAWQEKGFAEQGIDAFHGTAQFAAPDRIAVDGREIGFRHALIAAGARPVPLHIPGEEHVRLSDDFLELDALPSRIVLIGGGYIAAEFSHLAARAGAEVTVLQRGDRMLPAFDPDLVSWLMQGFRDLGIAVRTNAAAKAVERTARGFVVRFDAEGREESVEADLVIHAAGRGPALERLDLDAGGIAVEHGRLRLNDYLQSVSNPRVYAAGDAAARGKPLTPVASRDGQAVAANLLEGNRHRPDHRAVPSVAFTLPPIAMVGMQEAEARQQDRRFRVNAASTPSWFTARRMGEPVYGHKVLVEEDSGLILGAHLVGPNAEEVINLFALAIRHGLTAEALGATVFAYPTAASDIGSIL